jgi:hypothetical protein
MKSNAADALYAQLNGCANFFAGFAALLRSCADQRQSVGSRHGVAGFA